MAELRAVIVVDQKRRLKLPEGVPFQPGEKVHVLWDGRVLQVSRRRPRRLDEAYAKVQEESRRVLDMEELQRRLAEDQARKRRMFEEALGKWFKEDE